VSSRQKTVGSKQKAGCRKRRTRETATKGEGVVRLPRSREMFRERGIEFVLRNCWGGTAGCL